MRKTILVGIALGLSVLASVVVVARETPATQAAVNQDRFIRYVDQSDGSATLETSVVRLTKGDTTVDLIGAIHIADQAYFVDLNLRFKDYDAVLYELVKSGPGVPEKPAEVKEQQQGRGASMNAVGMLQKFMKNSLGLSYQIDEVDYTPANFIHADLFSDQFAKMSEERGQELWRLLLKSFTMDPNDPAVRKAVASQPGPMDLIRAMQAPDREARLKRMMGKTMEGADEMIDAMFGKESSVLIDARNERALEVLKEQMAAGKKKIAIFYGAGHMRKMEEVMLKDMGFSIQGDPTWLVAWQIPKLLPTTQPITSDK
jgi:hypothetical protein